MSQNNAVPLLKTHVRPARAKSKKPKIKVTPKQRLTAKAVLDNVGVGKPLRTVLRQAGYSEGIAKTPRTVTESRGFIQALNELGATDDELALVFRSGLGANRVDTIKGVSELSDVPDIALRVKTAVEVARLKGYSTEVKHAGATYNTFIQQNNLNPNAPENSNIVDSTLDMLMEQTKRV